MALEPVNESQRESSDSHNDAEFDYTPYIGLKLRTLDLNDGFMIEDKIDEGQAKVANAAVPEKTLPPSEGGQGGQAPPESRPAASGEEAKPTHDLDAQEFYEPLAILADTNRDGTLDVNELAAYKSQGEKIATSRLSMLDNFYDIATSGGDRPDTDPSDDVLNFGNVNSLFGMVSSDVADSMKAISKETGSSHMNREQLEAHRSSLLKTGDADQLEDVNNVLNNFDRIQDAQDATTISPGEALWVYHSALLNELASDLGEAADGSRPSIAEDLQDDVAILMVRTEDPELLTKELNSRLPNNSFFEYALRSANGNSTLDIVARGGN